MLLFNKEKCWYGGAFSNKEVYLTFCKEAYVCFMMTNNMKHNEVSL